jgi:hypothetical protein
MALDRSARLVDPIVDDAKKSKLGVIKESVAFDRDCHS